MPKDFKDPGQTANLRVRSSNLFGRAIIAVSKAVTRRITGITVRQSSQAFFDSVDP